MRTLLLLALAVAGCYRDAPSATTAPPANKQPPTEHAREAEDELAFLPKESEFVFGLDLTALRTSTAWRDQIEPAISSSNAFEKSRKLCGFDPWAPITHISIGARSVGSQTEMVLTLAGGDAAQEIGCGLKQLSTDYTAHPDGDVTILNKTRDNFVLGLAPVGHSHVIAVATPNVDAARVHAQLATGAPLRSSPSFMALYDKLDRGASLWFVINGNSRLFQSMSLGIRPRYIDGTLLINDQYVLTTRITMETPADASQLGMTLQGLSGQLKQMVESFDIRAEAEILHVDVVLTQPQMQTLLAMFGGLVP